MDYANAQSEGRGVMAAEVSATETGRNTILFDNIPGVLKARQIWCCWRAVPDADGKIQKVPWRLDGVGKLAWSNPLNLSAFDEIKAAYQAGLELPERSGKHFAGVGIIIPATGDLKAFDLDEALENGEIRPAARAILERIKTYSEISPSGNGLHGIALAELPDDSENLGAVKKEPLRINGQRTEFFSRSHFLTVTGQRLPEYSEHVEARRDEMMALYDELKAIRNAAKKRPAKETPSGSDRVGERARLYCDRALEDEAHNVQSSRKGARNSTLNDAALKIGHYVGADILSRSEVERTLLRAAMGAGLSESEARATIRSGIEKGISEPKEPNLKDDPLPGRHDACTCIDACTRDESQTEEAEPEVHAKALEILQHRDPIQFIADSCGRMVLGAEKAFKKLICCVAVQDIQQSAGLHPKLNGESGGGKTWALLTFAHHLPPEAVIKGSMSSKAGFYHNDGDRVFRILDDYQAGNEDIDTVIKQTSSVFHEPYTHRTVANHKAVILQIGREQTWAITSVDSSQDIQVLNRQIPINVDDSADLTKRVNARTIERYGKGDAQFPEDETVKVSREIWRVLRAEGHINVRVPYWQRIDWLDVSNRRNPSIFMDLLIAITAMNRYQREKDSDGCYLATEDDFSQAKALFTDKDAEELVNRLTKKEREFANLLINEPAGLTRDEVAEALDISPNRVSQLANGEKGKGGLSQKLSGFSIADVTDSIRLNEEQSRSIRKVVYKLTRYDHLTGFDAVVVLRPADDGKDGKPTVSQPVRKTDCKEIGTREREEIERDRESKESKDKVREPSSSPGGGRSKLTRSLRNEEKSLPDPETITGDDESTITAKLTHAYSPYPGATDSDKESLPLGESHCPACGAPTGPGYGHRVIESLELCHACGYHASAVWRAAKAHSDSFTTGQIFEDISGMFTRPPDKSRIAVLLRVKGYSELDGSWRVPGVEANFNKLRFIND